MRHDKLSDVALSVTTACCLSALLFAGTGDAPVADAASRGDKETARSLLKRGVDVNAAQGDGMTALHWAAMNNDVEFAQMLIYAGANVKAGTRIGGYTALFLAARNGNAAMIETLVKAGADPSAATTTGATPLMLAAASGSADAVEALLDHGADANAKESSRGETALMFAASSNGVAAVEVLLRHGADATVATKVVDVAALARAEAAERARSGRGGAGLTDDPDAPAGEGRRGQRAAAEPSTEGGKAAPASTEATKSAPAGAKPENSAADKESAQQGNRGFARATPYYELVGTQGGLTPLLFAARQGHIEAMHALIDGGADVNQVSPGDRTSPVLIATINGHFDCAKFLLDQGADPTLANAAGTTPLYGAINVQWAPHAFYPQPNAAQDKLTYLEMMNALLDRGADPDARLAKKVWHTGYNFDQSGVDETGATAFWRAAQADDLAAMRLLAEYGADPFIRTKIVVERQLPNGGNQVSGLTKEEAEKKAAEQAKLIGGPAVDALHAASGAGWDGNYHVNAPGSWMPAVKYLVEELGFDVNAADDKGNTPLHNAAARGDNEMILYLVSKGADATAVNKAGQTTADMANGPKQRIQPFPETVALLEKLGSKNNHKCVSC